MRRYTEEGPNSLENIARDTSLRCYVGMAMPLRPGVMECFTRLEYEHFPPKTARSALFRIVVIHWNDLSFIVVGIPVEESHLMEEVAAACGLRIVPGGPALIGPMGLERFPFASERMYTLESKPDHPIYTASPAEERRIIEDEIGRVEKFTGPFADD